MPLLSVTPHVIGDDPVSGVERIALAGASLRGDARDEVHPVVEDHQILHHRGGRILARVVDHPHVHTGKGGASRRDRLGDHALLISAGDQHMPLQRTGVPGGGVRVAQRVEEGHQQQRDVGQRAGGHDRQQQHRDIAPQRLPDTAEHPRQPEDDDRQQGVEDGEAHRHSSSHRRTRFPWCRSRPILASRPAPHAGNGPARPGSQPSAPSAPSSEKWIVNVEPVPWVERTLICPPCATTMRRVSARPMPWPSIALSRAVAVR